MAHQKYRDELVQLIRDAGQELIDRAEQMVSPGVDLITSFDIRIHVGNGFRDGAETIEWTTQVINKSTHERLLNRNRQ